MTADTPKPDETDARDSSSLYLGVLGQAVKVTRRRSDGMVWLRVDDGSVVAMDSAEAWALAQLLITTPEDLSEGVRT